MSRQGGDISPWSVTQRGDDGARYLQFADDAEAAAQAAGHDVEVNRAGTSGFGDRTPADANADPADPAPAPAPAEPAPTDADADDVDPEFVAEVATAFGEMSAEAEAFALQANEGVAVGEFLRRALGQDGDRYVWGADPDPNDPDPDAFDCAELVQWATEQIGSPNPGGSTNEQNLWLRDQGAIEVPVELAAEIPGAVLYSYSSARASAGHGEYSGHVAISLGNGETIEARGAEWGVGSWEIGNRFDTAFLLPGIDYTDLDGLDEAELEERANGVRFDPGIDSDHDMLSDNFEIAYGLDPGNPDADGDGITDGYEIVALGTDAMNPDSDYDGLTDDVELVLGFDPMVADNPDPEAEVELPDEWVDNDGDGIVDHFERVLGVDDMPDFGDDAPPDDVDDLLPEGATTGLENA
ncbi:MAG: hypothetical protein AAFZ07_07845 [Actinomycetota bacterium]